LVVLGKIGPGRNSAESSQVDLIGPIGPDKKSTKFYGVSPIGKSFRKFNLNLFYEKWILNFKLDPNIWIWILKKSNLLFLKNGFGSKI